MFPPPPFLRASAPKARPSTRMPGRKRERGTRPIPVKPADLATPLPTSRTKTRQPPRLRTVTATRRPRLPVNSSSRVNAEEVPLVRRFRNTRERERSQGLTRDTKAVVGTRRRCVLEEVDSAGARSNGEAGGRRAPEKKRAKDQASEKGTRKATERKKSMTRASGESREPRDHPAKSSGRGCREFEQATESRADADESMAAQVGLGRRRVGQTRAKASPAPPSLPPLTRSPRGAPPLAERREQIRRRRPHAKRANLKKRSVSHPTCERPLTHRKLGDVLEVRARETNGRS